jgi:hypothetical protein
MFLNTPTMDDGNIDNKANNNEQIVSQIYKNHMDIPSNIKTEEENTNVQENIQDISSNYLKQNNLNKLFPPENKQKRRISKTTFGQKKYYKNIKRVTIDNPFISIVPIESYKEYNLKMTYSEYESVPDTQQRDNNCPCKKPLCSIL